MTTKNTKIKCNLCNKEVIGYAFQKYCSPECQKRNEILLKRERQAELKVIEGELEKSSWDIKNFPELLESF